MTVVQPPERPYRPVLFMLASCACFAVMGAFAGAAHAADPAVGPVMASLVRAVVNLVLLLPLAGFSLSRLVGDARPALWLRGLLGAVSLLGYFWALQSVSIGEAAFLNQTSAVWVVVLSPFLLRERTRGLVWLAVGISLVGLLLIAHPRGDSLETVGRAVGLFSGLTSAGAYLSVRKASASNEPITIVFWFTIVATVLCAALALGFGLPWPSSAVSWALLVGTGVMATVGQLLMTVAYRDGPAAVVAATSAAAPLMSLLLGWAVLGEAMDLSSLGGMALLVVSSVLLPLWAAAPPKAPVRDPA